MAMAAAAQAEIQSFFASRHGQRTLIAASQRKLCDYFIAKNVTLSELPTVRPPEGPALTRWLEEWHDTAAAAGITDTLDARNVVRWMEEDDAAALQGTRSGKAFAVADALTSCLYSDSDTSVSESSSARNCTRAA